MFTLEQERSSLLDRILRVFSFFGVLTGILSIWISLLEGMVALAIVDGAACIIVVAIAFIPGIPFKAKLLTIVAVVFAVGVSVLYMTGPYGAGHIWIMCAVLLSALFGKRLATFAAFVVATFAMIAYGILSVLGLLPQAVPAVSIIIIGSNMIAICASLAYLIHVFMRDMEDGFKTQDILTKELHHRVKNNLQITLSLISLEAYGERPTPSIVSLERRVRILTVVNELFLDRPHVLRMDIRALTRAVSGCAQQWTIVADDGFGDKEVPVHAFEMDSGDVAHFAIGVGELLALLAPATVIIQSTPRSPSGPPRIRLRLAQGSSVDLVSAAEESLARDRTVRSLLESLSFRRIGGDSNGGPGFEIDAEG